MRILATILTVVLTGSLSCGGTEAADVSSTIEGRVRAGPVCPVEVAGSPCPPAPWSGTVRATRTDGETYEAVTDDDGAFTLEVPPGDYEVVAVIDGGGPPTAVPNTVSVPDGERVHVDLEVDTGIR